MFKNNIGKEINEKIVKKLRKELYDLRKDFWYYQGELPRRMAVDYFNELVFAITTQRYRFTPHSEEYRKWKERYGFGAGKTNFWELFGELMRNLVVRPEGAGKKAWYAGVAPGAKSRTIVIVGKKNRGGTTIKSKPINYYGFVVEYGIPPMRGPRPLFTKTLNYFVRTSANKRLEEVFIEMLAKGRWK